MHIIVFFSWFFCSLSFSFISLKVRLFERITLYFTLPTSDEKLIDQNHHQRDTPRWWFATRRSISRQLTRMVPLRILASAEIAKFKVPFRDSNSPVSTFPFPRIGIPFFRRFHPRFSSSSRRGGMESTISSLCSQLLTFVYLFLRPSHSTKSHHPSCASSYLSNLLLHLVYLYLSA